MFEPCVELSKNFVLSLAISTVHWQIRQREERKGRRKEGKKKKRREGEVYVLANNPVAITLRNETKVLQNELELLG